MNNQCFVDIPLLTSREDSNQFSLIGTRNQHHHENKEDDKETTNNRGIMMLSSAEKGKKEGGRGKGNNYNVYCAGSSSSSFSPLSLDPPLPFPSCLRVGFSLSPPSTGTLPAVCNSCKMNLHRGRTRTRFDCRVRLKHTAAPWKPMFMCITIDESCLDSNGRLLQNGTSFIAHQEEHQAAPITTFLNPNNPPAPPSRKDGQTPASSSITSVVDLHSNNDDYAKGMLMFSDTKCIDCCKRHYTTKRCRKILKHRALPHFTSYHRMTVATSTIKHNKNESGPPSPSTPPPPALKKRRTTNSITIPASSSFTPSSSATEEQKVFLHTGAQNKEKGLPSGVVIDHHEKEKEQRENDGLNCHFRRPRDPLHRFFDTEVVPECRTFVVRVVSTESSTFEVSRNSNDEQSICHDVILVIS